GSDVARGVSCRRNINSQTRNKRDHNKSCEFLGKPDDRRRTTRRHKDHLRRREAVQGELASFALRSAWAGDANSGRCRLNVHLCISERQLLAAVATLERIESRWEIYAFVPKNCTIFCILSTVFAECGFGCRCGPS